MKKRVFVIMLMLVGSLAAQEIEISKQEVIDIMIPEVIEGTCTPALLECLELPSDRCKADVEKLVRGSCSSPIPNTLTDMRAIKNISKEVAGCVAGGSRNDQLVKNISTPGCQALLQ